MAEQDHSDRPPGGTVLGAALARLRQVQEKHDAAFERLGLESVALDAAKEQFGHSLEKSAARLSTVANKLRQAFGNEPAGIRPRADDDRYDIN